MTDKAREFLEKVSESETLREKMEALCREKDEDTARENLKLLAERAGFSLVPDDFKPQQGELNEQELAAVVGGYNQCICPMLGLGTEDVDGHTCTCAIYGTGVQKTGPNTPAVYRCVCELGGYGDAPPEPD